jgi:hypothetical protein
VANQTTLQQQLYPFSLYQTSNTLSTHKTYDVSDLNPFQSNFSATHIPPSSYLFWSGTGSWITCNYPTVLKEKNKTETERVQPALSVG